MKTARPSRAQVAKNIKLWRTLKGWKQEQVADSLGIYQATISRWENGLQEPSFEQLDDLARLFGIHPALFLCDEGISIAIGLAWPR